MQNKKYGVQIWIQISTTVDTVFQHVLSLDDLLHVLKYSVITNLNKKIKFCHSPEKLTQLRSCIHWLSVQLT